MKIVKLNRRNFLKSTALVTGGLLLGFELPIQAKTQHNVAQLGPFLQMTIEGKIRLGLPVVEMGQGVYTSLAMCVLEELELGMNSVENIQTIHHPSFKNPVFSNMTRGVFSVQVTGGSVSMKGWTNEFQRIGAVAREILLLTASNYWDLSSPKLSIFDGFVHHPVNGNRIGFGELASMASNITISQNPITKSPNNYRIIGKPIKRWDTVEKINGAAVYGGDVEFPDLLYGTVVHSPVIGSTIKEVDESRAKNISGYMASIPIGDKVIVVANSTWTAFESSELLTIKTEGGYPLLNDEIISKQLHSDADKEGVEAGSVLGNVEEAFSEATQTIDYEYTVPMQAHACMEPLTATASVIGDSCEFWGPIQSQDAPVLVAMQAAGCKPEKVKVHSTYLGGGFGRKIEADFVVPPIIASKVMNRPVKITWTRKADMQGGFYRPPTLVKFKVGLNEENLPIGIKAKVVAPSATLKLTEIFGFFPPWIQDDGYDLAMMEGMLQQPSINPDGSSANQYRIPNIHVSYVPSKIPLKWAYWRAIGAGPNVFALESMIDEISIQGQKDTLEFRKILMSHNPRALNVLESAKTHSKWNKPDKGNFQGISYSDYCNSIQAQVAELSVSSKGRIKIHKITCVIDCGQIVNPHIVHQQIEGAIIFGLTATLMGEINVREGKVIQSNFDDYPMIRLKDTPEINIHLIESQEKSGGVGEPGTPLIGPAVANAVFAATGIRVRRLPIRKGDLA